MREKKGGKLCKAGVSACRKKGGKGRKSVCVYTCGRNFGAQEKRGGKAGSACACVRERKEAGKMVLGLGSRNKKVHVDYELRLLEIKPWQQQPVKGFSLHWQQRGDSKHTGKSKTVPLQKDERIEFKEGFKLPVTLYREPSKKGSKSAPGFQEKLLVFYLFESSSSSSNGKASPLARVSFDLAPYGALEEHISITLPMTLSAVGALNPKPPSLSFTLGPYHSRNSKERTVISREEYDRSKSMPADNTSTPSLSRRNSDAGSLPPPLDEQTQASLLASLLSEGEEDEEEEEEIAVFTDDDEDKDENEKTKQSPVVKNVVAVADLPQREPPPVVASDKSKPEPLMESPVVKNMVAAVDLPRPELSPVASDKSKSKDLSVTKNESTEIVVDSRPSPAKAAAAAAAAAYASKRTYSASGNGGGSSRGSSVDFSSEPESSDMDAFYTPHMRSPAFMVKSPARSTLSESSSNNHLWSDGRFTLEGLNKPPHPPKLEPEDSFVVGLNKPPHIPKPEPENRFVVGLNKPPHVPKPEPEDRFIVGLNKPLDVPKPEPEDSFVVGLNKPPHAPKLEPEDSFVAGLHKPPHAPELEFEDSFVVGLNKSPHIPKLVSVDSFVVKKTEEVLDREKLNVKSPPIKSSVEELSENPEKILHHVKSEKIQRRKEDVETKNIAVKTEVANSVEKTGGKPWNKAGTNNSDKINKSNNRSLKNPPTSKPKLERKIADTTVEKKGIVLENLSSKVSVEESRNEKIEKKVLEEAKSRAAIAEAKVAEAEAKAMLLESHIEKFKGELIDAAAIEAALYSMVAEHGSSSHKVHTPARRLARLYIYACKSWTQERRAISAKNSVSGLVLVVRACGNDVPRLTYWWSNVVVLRETIRLTFDKPESHTSKSIGVARSQKFSPRGLSNDWREASTFLAALERVESWIHGKVVESIWWQVFTPWMQNFTDENLNHTRNIGKDTNARRGGTYILGPQLGDGRQGDVFLDIWKRAFADAFESLCPVRGAGIDCGCLSMLARLVMDSCVARLDVAMLNAVLRGSEEDVPTDPISDPISNLNVLPISTGNLSFGSGAQLKNTMVRLSTCITDLFINDQANCNDQSLVEENSFTFPLLKAVGGLLMIPKDMLIDKAMRKEVCPTLNLALIRRILFSFVPDEFSPDPISPSLLAAINSEISVEREMHGETNRSLSSNGSVSAPKVVYTPPPSSFVREWIGDPGGPARFGRINSSLMRKGHTSDDELDEVESPISWLTENCSGTLKDSTDKEKAITNGNRNGSSPRGLQEEPGRNQRFQFLRNVWIGK